MSVLYFFRGALLQLKSLNLTGLQVHLRNDFVDLVIAGFLQKGKELRFDLRPHRSEDVLEFLEAAAVAVQWHQTLIQQHALALKHADAL